MELIINESQLHLSSWNEQHQRTGRPVEDAYSSSYSEWNVDKILKHCVVVRSFTADGNLLQPTEGCDQNTLTHHIFSCFLCTHDSVAHDIGSRCVAHVIPSMFHVVVVLILFDSPLCALHRLSHLLPRSTLCTSANEEPDSFVDNAPLTDSHLLIAWWTTAVRFFGKLQIGPSWWPAKGSVA